MATRFLKTSHWVTTTLVAVLLGVMSVNERVFGQNGFGPPPMGQNGPVIVMPPPVLNTPPPGTLKLTPGGGVAVVPTVKSTLELTMKAFIEGHKLDCSKFQKDTSNPIPLTGGYLASPFNAAAFTLCLATKAAFRETEKTPLARLNMSASWEVECTGTPGNFTLSKTTIKESDPKMGTELSVAGLFVLFKGVEGGHSHTAAGMSISASIWGAPPTILDVGLQTAKQRKCKDISVGLTGTVSCNPQNGKVIFVGQGVGTDFPSMSWSLKANGATADKIQPQLDMTQLWDCTDGGARMVSGSKGVIKLGS